MVGHSLGAHGALGLGCDPPAGLRAIVLIDGGFLTPPDFNALGMPVLSGRTELTAWMQSNELCFPDWATATRKVAEMVSADVSPALEAYVREVMVEADGEVRRRASPEKSADLVLAVVGQDVVALGRRLQVPTLLIACGQPPSSRPVRERAWRALVDASPMVELHVADEWGHNPVLQAPEASSSLIADWLRAASKTATFCPLKAGTAPGVDRGHKGTCAERERRTDPGSKIHAAAVSPSARRGLGR